jgi:succinyl-CoA synthetase beta subunit
MHYLERVAYIGGLRYIKIPGGNVGVISNSAGQCMALMDSLVAHGCKPANFMDLQGAAYHEKIISSLLQLESDP